MKEYYAEQYKLALSDYKIAKNEDEKHDALRRMCSLENDAIRMGFGDELKKSNRPYV